MKNKAILIIVLIFSSSLSYSADPGSGTAPKTRTQIALNLLKELGLFTVSTCKHFAYDVSKEITVAVGADVAKNYVDVHYLRKAATRKQEAELQQFIQQQKHEEKMGQVTEQKSALEVNDLKYRKYKKLYEEELKETTDPEEKQKLISEFKQITQSYKDFLKKGSVEEPNTWLNK